MKARTTTSHLHVYLDSMVQKHPVHSFSDHLHSSEREGQVGQTSTHPGSWQCFLNINTDAKNTSWLHQPESKVCVVINVDLKN